MTATISFSNTSKLNDNNNKKIKNPNNGQNDNAVGRIMMLS